MRWTHSASLSGYFVKKIGANRGRPRIWLENLEVSSAGMKPGDRFDIKIHDGVVTLEADANGSRVVSRKTHRSGHEVPVIDINSRELLALFEGMDAVRLMQREGKIYLSPLASEIKKKSRLNRLKRKVEQNEPLTMGSLSHGAGLLSRAIQNGLAKAGLSTEHGLTNEIRPELLEHSYGAGKSNSVRLPVAVPMK